MTDASLQKVLKIAMAAESFDKEWQIKDLSFLSKLNNSLQP